jgi:hypothetical protein
MGDVVNMIPSGEKELTLNVVINLPFTGERLKDFLGLHFPDNPNFAYYNPFPITLEQIDEVKEELIQKLDAGEIYLTNIDSECSYEIHVTEDEDKR